jgi:hypothetical protein
MTFDCWKCKVKCIPGTPEEGPPTAGKSARKGQMDYKLPASGKRITYIPMVCPSCHKTRGMDRKE